MKCCTCMHKENLLKQSHILHNCAFNSVNGNFIVSPEEIRGYLGFSTVTPLLQRFPFGCDNLKNILVRPFKIWYVGIYGQCHECYCDLDLQFQVTGGLLKVRFWPFFHILAQFTYTESQIILCLVYIIHICILCKHAEI